MTVTLRKSELPVDFEERVETFIKKLRAHRFTIDEAAPTESDLIESCIQRVQHPIKEKKPDDFISSYTIIDDTPPPPPPLTLAEKKNRLHFAVIEQEQKHCSCILPPGKARLFSIRYQDLSVAKAGALASKGQSFSPAPEDKAFMEEYEQIVARLDKCHRDVAHILSEIEDLTEDNIDSWIPPVLS